MASFPAASQQTDAVALFANAHASVLALVAGLTRKNELASVQRLHQLVDQGGRHLQVVYLSALLDAVSAEDLASAPPRDEDRLRLQLLGQELACLLDESAASHRLNQVVRGPRVHRLASLFPHWSLLGLKPISTVLLGLVLSGSDQHEARSLGERLIAEHTQAALESFDPVALPPAAVRVLLAHFTTVAPKDPLLEQLAARLAASDHLSARFLSPVCSSPDRPNMSSARKSLIAGLREDLPASTGGDHPPSNLAATMRQLGYPCCATPDAVSQVLKLAHYNTQNPPRSADVAAVLAMMIQPSGPSEAGLFMPVGSDGKHEADSANAWNVDNFIKVVRSLNPSLDAHEVFRALDRADLPMIDEKGFNVLRRAFAAMGMAKFPVTHVLARWSHLDAQLSFLRACIAFMPELFADPQLRKVTIDFEGVEGLKPFPPQMMHPAYGCLELTNLLLGISETTQPNQIAVKQILEPAAIKYPDLLLLSLAQADEYLRNAYIRKQYIALLLPSYFAPNHSSGPMLLPRLWHTSKDVVAQGMVETYRRDPAMLSRLLDVAFELKGIMTILESKSISVVFAIDFAVLASRREYLNLEKWLQDQLMQHGAPFFRGCLDFLLERVVQAPGKGVPLQPESITTLFKTLAAQAETIPADLMERLRLLQAEAAKANAKLAGLSADAAGGEGSRGTFSPDVEEEANSYFQRVYKNQMTIEELVVLLQRFKTSTNQRELEIFACMIHNLFDEYRFFPKYPDKELMITGKIFGALIENQLVSYGPLAIALRYVLDALRKPPASKMFKFGVQALLQFRSRFGEWPQYCSHIVQIPHLKQTHPEIIAYIESALAQSEHARATAPQDSSSPPMGAAQGPLSPTGTGGFEGGEGAGGSRMPALPEPGMTSGNASALLELVPVQAPSPGDKAEDRVAFLLNNLSQATVEQTAKDVLEAVGEEGLGWFAHYLVVRRVSTETNLHGLYYQLVEHIKSPQLDAQLLSETYRSVRALLASDKLAASSSLRMLLKNLGVWLGMLTLARNKPILHAHLPLKEVLLQAYDQNTLVAVIPFVCKVMDQITKSKIFKPPNPWTMGILRLLAELYQSVEMRLNLKFEFEVLLKALKMEVRDIEPSNLLKNRRRQALEERPRNEAAGQPLLLPPELRGAQRFITAAMEAAVLEISPAVVERSVKIACITTRELILKDFAMEPDENKMRKMAHLMVANLASSLALVACKDPLRQSLSNHLRVMAQNGTMDPHTLEATLGYALHDANLEFMSKYIENQAQERAITEIDQELAHAFTIRKKHREKTGTNYYDMSLYTAAARYASYIPEPLRLKPTGLNADQLRVYQDFTRVRTMAMEQMAHDEAAGIARDPQLQLPPQVLQAQGMPPPPSSAHYLNDRFVRLMADAERAQGKIVYPLSANPPDGELVLLVRTFMQIVSTAENREEAITFMAQRALLTMFDRPPSPADPVIILCGFMLDRLSEVAKRLVREIMLAALRLLDDGKHNWVAIVALIKARIMTITDLIKHFVGLYVRQPPPQPDVQPITSDFVARVILKVFVQDEVEAPPIDGDTPNALEYFARMVKSGHGGALSEEMARAFSGPVKSRGVLLFPQGLVAPRPFDAPPMMVDMDPSKSPAPLSFDEWLRFSMDPMNGETNISNFLKTRLAKPLTDDGIAFLVRSALDSCFADFFATGSAVSTYPIADSFARLCTLLVRHSLDPLAAAAAAATATGGAAQPPQQPGTAPATGAGGKAGNRVVLLDKILSVIVLYACNLTAQKKVFPQRTLARIFSSMLFELNTPHRVVDPVRLSVLLSFGEALHALRPTVCPGWAFSWLELVSHRMFMPKILATPRGWFCYHRLLVDVFKFMAPFLRVPELNESLRHLYRGTLHVLLVLLHDFPEFLCEYHGALCDPLPPTAVQLRNLVLSAFPRNMRLPDPFTPNLKVDLLPDINTPPRIASTYMATLNASTVRPLLDDFLKNRDPALLFDLRSKLMLQPHEAREAGTSYNVPLINAVVLYVGVQAVAMQLQRSNIPHSPPMDVFRHLVLDLDPEGKYLLLNAIANQLRFPNSHTHFFSCVILCLFSDVNSEAIQEQITRVLLERLIVNRPHPWGLLITFIELIKNTQYNFWAHSFTRCAPEIEWLFESVGRSCMVPQAAQQQQAVADQ